MTITNVGVFGVDSGTPIINPGRERDRLLRRDPQAAVGRHGRRRRSDEIAIRHVTQLAVSFDHRLIDGELGSRFLSDVAAILDDPARGLVWG